MDFEYQGKTYPKLYCLTITTRHTHDLQCFKKDLLQFLDSIQYPARIYGKLEYHTHKKDQIHMHGLTSWGQPPKNNRQNEFHFHLSKVRKDGPALWLEYCNKDYQLTDCLFSDSDDE